MIRIRDNVWIKETDVTVVSVNDRGDMLLDETFIVHPKFITDVCTALNVNFNEVNGQIERAKSDV